MTRLLAGLHRMLLGTKDSSPLQTVQTGPGNRPAACSMYGGGSFSGGKKTGARTNQSPRLIQKLRMGTTSLPFPQILREGIGTVFIFVCKYSITALSRYLIHDNNNHEFVITKTYARNQHVYRLILLRHSNPTYIFSATSRSERVAQAQEEQPSATTLVTY